MIIDVHTHISIYENNVSSLDEAYDLLCQMMNDTNVQYALVIPDNEDDVPTIAGFQRAQELTKENKRIFLIGSPQILGKATSELNFFRSLFENNTIYGLKFFCGHDDYYPNDERCMPYYELCQELGYPVVFHTGENSEDSECAKYNDPKYIVEVAQKFPKLKCVIAHFFWPKIDYCYDLTKNVPNIYFDLAGTADEEVITKSGGWEKMQSVLSQVVRDRPSNVIYGTDWPMCEVQRHMRMVEEIAPDEATRQKIFAHNAIRVYRLPVQAE
jgi:hypothetical protein